MNESLNESPVFEVLGKSLKLKSLDDFAGKNPELIISKVNKASDKIKQNIPHASDYELAVLTALDLANELIECKLNLKEAINDLKNQNEQALSLIDQIDHLPKNIQ